MKKKPITKKKRILVILRKIFFYTKKDLKEMKEVRNQTTGLPELIES